MARSDILSTLYSKKTTALDFNYDSLIAPPLYTLIPNQDLERMYKLVTSIKYTSKIEYKEAEIRKIMEYYGFIRMASGTHRVVYRHLDFPTIVAKISLNKTSLLDNVREFHNQVFLKPFCCKCFEVDQSGMIGIFERVEPILSREEFMSVAGDIFDFINEKLIGKYIVDDIGTESFMNYGMRVVTPYSNVAFGPVLLDYPEVYPLDGNKLYCNKQDPRTGMFCGGILDYDPGFNTVSCKICGRHYEARELQKMEENHEIIKKGASKNMKMEIKRGDTIIKTVDSNTTPTNFIQPPEKKKTYSSNQMSIINNPRPRGKFKKSPNNPESRNAVKVAPSHATHVDLGTRSNDLGSVNTVYTPKSKPGYVYCVYDTEEPANNPDAEDAAKEQNIGFFQPEEAGINLGNNESNNEAEEAVTENSSEPKEELMEEKQSFNNAFAEALKNLAIEPKDNDSEEENDDAAEDELGGEPEDEASADSEGNCEPKNDAENDDDAAEDELGGEPKDEAPAAEEVYNADTGFIPPIEETPANNGSSASNPFVGR